ncbi:phage virion morphogenesis protein [Sedimentitalea sp. JM2-8]|uniref:Phage virion morphogenesis protein n=1 Tax=Sedimentitalea xiamensis TaxID=3050037 RepID=A0ABT7FLP5_9RHOB|nr:phage virion morphogenesis protein [Sedimentitalea xiamensis]MDK3075930.1 phage virion morphogenesis protein [Sedimentitalea xiamensis]
MIEIEFENDTLTPALQRLADGLLDMTPVMGEISEGWLENTINRMLRGEQPDGQPFAPRSPVSLEQYAASGFGAVPLFRKGWMRQGLFPEYGSDFVRIGSNEPQSAVMQFGASQGEFGRTSRGGPIPWGDIPARPYLGVSDEDETMIIEELSEWLMRTAEGKS